MKIKIKALTENGKDILLKIKKDYNFKTKLLMRLKVISENEIEIEPKLKQDFVNKMYMIPIKELQKETEGRWFKVMEQYGAIMSNELQDYSLEVLNE